MATEFEEHLEDAGPAEHAGIEAPPAEVYTASQWRLMWWKFRKHRLAVLGGLVVLSLYIIAAFAEFLAPYTLSERDVTLSYAPPQRLHFVAEDGFHPWPFVYGLKSERHPETLRKVYVEDKSRRYPIRFFVRGEPYRLWGLFETDLHLFGVDEGGTLFLLGADSLGRDLLSRIIYGARISLTIGLIGVALSFLLGLLIGGFSGYIGGWVDNLIQRLIEILRSFPSIPLWMALSAALPAHWSPLQIYLGITVVLSFIGWTGLARQVRGKILSLREEDFAVAAQLCGASRMRILWRHLLPSFMSHIIVSITLAVPGMILGESGCGKSVTALSILRLVTEPGRIVSGDIVLHRDGRDVPLTALDPESEAIRRIRGGAIAMIFQEPMTSLSPVHTVGNQIVEAITLHTGKKGRAARDHAVHMLQRVGIPDAGRRIRQYPHEMSGGMRQRAMIAMALSCQPALLIADEPTTALDVTIQAQILELMRDLQDEFGMSILLITHDLGVVAEMARDVAVMYLGRVVEHASAQRIFAQPQHPYTRALMQSIPGRETERKAKLKTITGSVPDPFQRIRGCPFHPRCPEAEKGLCDIDGPPPLLALEPGHTAACLVRHREFGVAPLGPTEGGHE